LGAGTIERIELRQIRLPLLDPFETSTGRTSERQIILVRLRDAGGAEGWGECVAGENPTYSEEWTETAWPTIQQILAPLLVGRELSSAGECAARFAHVRENPMAKAALETACWDLEARRTEVPLARLLGGTRAEIASGVSIGLQPSLDVLLDKVSRELESGYQRIKIKIKPGKDVALLEAVRAKFPGIALMADANSAYRLSDAPLLRQLDRFKLMMIEQPLAHDDIADHARLQREIETPICLDESIRSAANARLAIESGACRIINLKVGRVGGHGVAREIESICRERGIGLWSGGMLEAGIGRAHNIALSSLAGFTLPGDVSASARYFDEDIIEPPVTVSSRGMIAVPPGPGIGFTVRLDRIEALTVRSAVIS